MPAKLKNTRIALISCSKLKAPDPGEISAWKRYWPSPLFRLSYEFARDVWKADQIYILSAKYGIISHHSIIPTYDQTLSKMPRGERLYWGLKAANQLEEMSRHGGRAFLVLAGNTYTEHLNLQRVALNGNRIESPLKGLALGRRLSWLKNALLEFESHGFDDLIDT